MNVDQSVSGAADDNGHYLENSSAVLCWPSSRSCRHAFADAGAWPDRSVMLQILKDFDQFKRKTQSLVVVANPTFLCLS